MKPLPPSVLFDNHRLVPVGTRGNEWNLVPNAQGGIRANIFVWHDGEVDVIVGGSIVGHGITFDGSTLRKSFASGWLVRVRPVDDTTTYLGVVLGDFPRSMSAWLDQASGVLAFELARHNPAIWVPSLERIVFGCGSWWSRIKSPKDFSKITDERINTTWYVKLATAILEGNGRATQ